MPDVLPKRSELPAEHTWDVASVFPDDASWEAAAADLERMIPLLESFRGRRGESAASLLEWLLLFEKLIVDSGRVFTYAHMLHDGDTADPVAAARWERVTALGTRVFAAHAGDATEIAAIGREKLDRF